MTNDYRPMKVRPTVTITRNTPQTVQDCPILQYSSGHTEARFEGLSRFQGFVGFHMEANKDSALDAALKAAGVLQITIRHPRSGAPPAIVPHWSFGESIRIYPITAGPPATTIGGCLRTNATAEAGIGLSWPAGERSKLAVRGLIMVGDAPVLVQLSVKSTMTDHLLAALLDHYRVCEAADKLIKRAQHPEMVAFHELALPLIAGAEIPAGRGETAQIAPLRSDHPSAIEKAYISSCWRKNIVHDAALAAWPGIVAWAAGYRTGETNGDSHLEESLL
jgi:hypothetical protein